MEFTNNLVRIQVISNCYKRQKVRPRAAKNTKNTIKYALKRAFWKRISCGLPVAIALSFGYTKMIGRYG